MELKGEDTPKLRNELMSPIVDFFYNTPCLILKILYQRYWKLHKSKTIFIGLLLAYDVVITFSVTDVNLSILNMAVWLPTSILLATSMLIMRKMDYTQLMAKDIAHYRMPIVGILAVHTLVIPRMVLGSSRLSNSLYMLSCLSYLCFVTTLSRYHPIWFVASNIAIGSLYGYVSTCKVIENSTLTALTSTEMGLFIILSIIYKIIWLEGLIQYSTSAGLLKNYEQEYKASSASAQRMSRSRSRPREAEFWISSTGEKHPVRLELSYIAFHNLQSLINPQDLKTQHRRLFNTRWESSESEVSLSHHPEPTPEHNPFAEKQETKIHIVQVADSSLSVGGRDLGKK